MNIARIITNSKKFKENKFIGKYSTIGSDDTKLPTLIIGKENAEKIYGKENVHVLNKKIKNNVYWTYSIMENRMRYEDDLNVFYENVYSKLCNRITYINFNLFIEPFYRVKKFIDFIFNSSENKVIFFTEKHIYIYYKKYVFGISIDQIKYFNVNLERIKNKLSKNNNNVLLYNDNFLSYDIRKYINCGNILVPYLYYLSVN